MKVKGIFTPEVLASIPGMVKQGMRSGEIATLLGCTTATLAVRCSEHGISLRRDKPVNPVILPRLKNAAPKGRPRTLSKATTDVLHRQAEARARDVNDLTRDLLELIARDDLFDAVLDERELV
jgi:hypothetical protein